MSEFVAKKFAVYTVNEVMRSRTLPRKATTQKIENTFDSSFLGQLKSGIKKFPKKVLTYFRVLSSGNSR